MKAPPLSQAKKLTKKNLRKMAEEALSRCIVEKVHNAKEATIRPASPEDAAIMMIAFHKGFLNP